MSFVRRGDDEPNAGGNGNGTLGPKEKLISTVRSETTTRNGRVENTCAVSVRQRAKSQRKRLKGRLTFGSHADRQALLEAALLTFPPHVHVDLAAVAVLALVDGVLRDAATEETCRTDESALVSASSRGRGPSSASASLTFASFAGESVVVVARSSIAAHQTQLLLLPRRRSLLLLGVAETVDRVAVDAARWRQIFSTCQKSKQKKETHPPIHSLSPSGNVSRTEQNAIEGHTTRCASLEERARTRKPVNSILRAHKGAPPSAINNSHELTYGSITSGPPTMIFSFCPVSLQK